jgi:hypothetical protein
MPGHLALRVGAAHGAYETRYLTDSGLLLSGSGRWLEWHLSLRLVDFGTRAVRFTLEKIGDGLHTLGFDSSPLESWASVIQGYGRFACGDAEFTVQSVEQDELPGQYDLSWGDVDDKGVVRIARACRTGKQDQVYNVALIGHQALGMKDLVGSLIQAGEIKSALPAVEPAYQWLADHMAFLAHDAVVWNYQFDHVYNDVMIKAPWQSAIGQAYVLRALQQAVLEKRVKPPLDYEDMLVKGSRTYTIRTEDGGVQSVNRFGNVFYEEVPNNTHILNAHLVSTLVLGELYHYSGEVWHRELFEQGLQTLHTHLHLYDTGYWLRYDLNPKKEMLFQIDWIEGEISPLISEILLVNPQTGHATQVLAGQESFQGQAFPCLSGMDWLAAETSDGQWGRGFCNGYQVRNGAVEGGTRHNVYFWGALPDRSFEDCFDVPAHILMVRYKDVSPGKFALRIQKINQASHLAFAPLRDATWHCNGDGLWKELVVKVFPQDMGWYVGPEYQRYHIALLRSLAERTGSWLFQQYAEKQAAHMEVFEAELASHYPGNRTGIAKN